MQIDIISVFWGILPLTIKSKLCLRRDFFMSTQGFIKGMAAGLVLGACATMIWDPVSDRQRHRMQRKTEGVFRSIGNIIDNALDFMR